MTKTWEPRVGKLFTDDYFAWSYKPTDSPKYGGQPRVDYLACDLYGAFWMVEVKQLSTNRKSINLEREVTVGQRDALDAVTEAGAVALLMVGQGKFLYAFTWGRVQWLRQRGVWPLLPLEEASAIFEWKGPRAWTNQENARKFHRLPLLLPPYKIRGYAISGSVIPPIQEQPSDSSEDTGPSLSILRQTGFTPTMEEMEKANLVRSFSMPENEASSSAPSRTGGGKS